MEKIDIIFIKEYITYIIMTSMNMQPIINIGMLGSVSDGKSTTVYSLTGIKTQRHSDEMKRNITIKPGYANAKIYKNKTDGYNINGEGELVHHVSFIDCPGHYQLIVTMLSCIQLMDGIILVVSAAEPIDMKPQLVQHIMAIRISGIKNVIVVFNKLDLVKKQIAKERYAQLYKLLKEHEIEPKIIIPASMNYNIGMDYLLNSIMMYMGPRTNNTSNPLFMISRSFDINHVNIPFDKIEGGVIGGSLISGEFKIGDEIEIQPGIIGKNEDGTMSHKPHFTKILSLKSEKDDLTIAKSGGLIGIKTNIDPFYCKNDNMIGMVAGLKGTLPPVYYNIVVKYQEINFDQDHYWIKNIGRKVILIVGTSCIETKILNCNDNYIKLELSKPLCISEENNIILCDKTSSSFQIVGYGKLSFIDDFSNNIVDDPIVFESNNEDDSNSSSIDIDNI
jgi:translation initiation factor 2 subunit 3